MNILDIAIAKKLAGGGGGSGTDNYNDLSNLPKINDTTLSGNKSSLALGLQSEINSDSKLASDLVDDTNQDNKFVTSTEKNTWNAKQNAIDSDHKLSSDLVDDANKTNKFVTSTEKNTWNAKQNAIDSEHKLSSSLVSFTDAEAAALASGIDSSKVGQISTNQTNILYAIRNGVKNQLKLTGDVWNPNTLYVYWDYENGTVRVTGSKATTSTVFINLGSWTAPEDGVYRLYANAEACTANIRVFDDANWNTYTAGGDSNEATWTKGTTRTVYVRIASGVVVGDITVTPMICQKSVFDADPTFAPYSAPNSDLTYLEAEDRAALAEVVDSGAKNLFDYHGRGVNTNLTSFVNNGDGSFTAKNNSQITAADISYITVSLKSGINYVLSGSPAGGGTDSYQMDIRTTAGVFVAGSDSGNGFEFSVPTTGEYRMCFRFGAGYTIPSSGITFYPMICTKAAFGVSKAFVPYRPNYDLVVSKLNNVGVTKTIIPFTASAADTYELITATKITLPAEKVLRITAGAIYQGTYATGIKLIRGTSIEHSKTLAISESTYDYNVLSTSSIYRASSNQDIYVALKCNAASTVNIVLAYDIL